MREKTHNFNIIPYKKLLRKTSVVDSAGLKQGLEANLQSDDSIRSAVRKS